MGGPRRSSSMLHPLSHRFASNQLVAAITQYCFSTSHTEGVSCWGRGPFWWLYSWLYYSRLHLSHLHTHPSHSEAGEVWAWGCGESGQLGVGRPAQSSSKPDQSEGPGPFGSKPKQTTPRQVKALTGDRALASHVLLAAPRTHIAVRSNCFMCQTSLSHARAHAHTCTCTQTCTRTRHQLHRKDATINHHILCSMYSCAHL